MTLLAPSFLAAAFVAVLAAALHLTSTRRRTAQPFPTIRFVPERAPDATVRAVRRSDPLLLVLRVVILLSLGVALAQLLVAPRRVPVARVVALDLSRTTADLQEARDSALAYLRPGDALVVFDSAARSIPVAPLDSLGRGVLPHAPGSVGSLSAALVAALGEIPALRSRADSLELVLVSAFDTETVDAATVLVRAQWRGRARLVRVSAPELASAAPPESADRARWATESRPRGVIARAAVDEAVAVASGREVVVASFSRGWDLPAESLARALVVARWVDGGPAAFVWAATDGRCVLSSMSQPDSLGDQLVRSDLARLATSVGSACGPSPRPGPVPGTVMALLAGPPSALPTDTVPAPEYHLSPAMPWLLALALALSVAEPFVRRRRDRSG